MSTASVAPPPAAGRGRAVRTEEATPPGGKRFLGRVLEAFFTTRLGYAAVRALVAATQYRVFAPRTVHAMRFDALRLRARTRQGARGTVAASHAGLHLGCGTRRVPGWMNVDVAASEHDVDLACGSLPWRDGSFDRVVSQQVIEHLDLATELVPLFRELRRVCRPGAELWVSCPDLAKTCRAYDADRGAALLADRDARVTDPAYRFDADSANADLPPQHYINMLFDQMGEHRNLLDVELIQWLCGRTGFGACTRVSERELRTRFPEFPPRGDEFCAVYVRAVAGA